MPTSPESKSENSPRTFLQALIRELNQVEGPKLFPFLLNDFWMGFYPGGQRGKGSFRAELHLHNVGDSSEYRGVFLVGARTFPVLTIIESLEQVPALVQAVQDLNERLRIDFQDPIREAAYTVSGSELQQALHAIADRLDALTPPGGTES